MSDFIPCAWHACSYPAVCRLKLPTGWANLCSSHYDSHWRDVARDYCEDHGLLHGDDHEDFSRRLRAFMARPRPTPKEHWAKVADGNFPEYSKQIARELLKRGVSDEPVKWGTELVQRVPGEEG